MRTNQLPKPVHGNNVAAMGAYIAKVRSHPNLPARETLLVVDDFGTLVAVTAQTTTVHNTYAHESVTAAYDACALLARK